MRRRSSSYAGLSFVLIGTLFAVLPQSPVQADSEQSANSAKWNWLADSYWIVPKSYLMALLFDPSSQQLTPVSDQTVYHITGYTDGYFWGKTAIQLGPDEVTCASLVGSVTPQGRLLLSFTFLGENDAVTQQQGFGQLVESQGQWSMVNQTAAPTFAH